MELASISLRLTIQACQPGAADDAAQALLYLLARRAVPAAPYYFPETAHLATWRAAQLATAPGCRHNCTASCMGACPPVLRHPDCTALCRKSCCAGSPQT